LHALFNLVVKPSKAEQQTMRHSLIELRKLDRKESMRQMFHDYRLLIIDEISMCDVSQLGRIDQILKELIPEKRDLPFSGTRSVEFFYNS
jgi:hypothetical protein